MRSLVIISRSLYIKEAVLTRKAKANWNDSFNSYQKEKREEAKIKNFIHKLQILRFDFSLKRLNVFFGRANLILELCTEFALTAATKSNFYNYQKCPIVIGHKISGFQTNYPYLI